MRLPHFRVRTLMVVVGVAALLLWGQTLGARSYHEYTLAREYGARERGWRSIAAEGRWDAKFASECADYFAGLARKHRQAMWRPWVPATADPHAPGYDAWVEQERRRTKTLAPPAALPAGRSRNQ